MISRKLQLVMKGRMMPGSVAKLDKNCSAIAQSDKHCSAIACFHKHCSAIAQSDECCSAIARQMLQWHCLLHSFAVQQTCWTVVTQSCALMFNQGLRGGA
jgi:hypothetical protein